MAKAFSRSLRYNESLGWMKYGEGVWKRSETGAQKYSQDLTLLQIQEADRQMEDALKSDDPSMSSAARKAAQAEACEYRNFALSRRSSARIASTLKEARPALYLDTEQLDADPILLNTPSGEVHLDTGDIASHDPLHYLTHITSCTPSSDGADEWETFVRQIVCNDDDMAAFFQQIAGMIAVGRVYEERLFIAVGNGGNGKSTFFNALQCVLGDYACSIRSELFISSNDSGKKFEYAALRGTRFALAEELQEGKRLDTGAVKHLCSTGEINAQYKGKDIFTFKPSHTTVLCTNYFPEVDATDKGTWDRLVVLPFNARFRNKTSEKKNYAQYLVDNCGGAILSWIIEGAKIFITNGYKLVIPDCVIQATEQYRSANDWTAEFLSEYTIYDPNGKVMGSELYTAYENYCESYGKTPLSMRTALPMIAEKAGVAKQRSNSGIVYPGIKIKPVK